MSKRRGAAYRTPLRNYVPGSAPTAASPKRTKDEYVLKPARVPSILVLAGQRSGALDPLAERAGVSHKCLVPVLGEAMIGRVLRIVAEAFPSAPIYVSIEDPAVIREEPTVARLTGEGSLHFVEAQFNMVDSVHAASSATGFPILVTTADNVLTTVEALHALAQAGAAGRADAIAVMARKEAIQAAHPGGKGRYYEFRDGGFSNCNLFWIDRPEALRAAEAFRHGGQFLKVKGRIMQTFGLLNLIRFRLKLFSLEQCFGFVSKRLGARIRPLVLADGRLAIDVDDFRSHEMAEELLAPAA